MLLWSGRLWGSPEYGTEKQNGTDLPSCHPLPEH